MAWSYVSGGVSGCQFVSRSVKFLFALDPCVQNVRHVLYVFSFITCVPDKQVLENHSLIEECAT